MTAANVIALPERARYADALIEPGRYDARVVDAETRMFFFGRSPRAIVWFQIASMGAAFETILPAYYAVRSITGKPRRHGRFRIGLRSRLARDLAAMLNRRPPLDVVPLDELVNALFAVDVVTVDTDATQQAIPAGARYSKVARVLGVAER